MFKKILSIFLTIALMLSVTQYAFAVETPAAAPQAAGTNDKVEVTKDGVTTYYTTL